MFTQQYKTKAKALAQRLGLENTTTKRMKSLMFWDPIASVSYGLYPSGYIRRFIRVIYYNGCNGCHAYQLNPVIRVKGSDGRTNSERIMLTPEAQLEVLKKAVKKYRK